MMLPLTFVPTLTSILATAERSKGGAAVRSEVEQTESKGSVMAMHRRDAPAQSRRSESASQKRIRTGVPCVWLVALTVPLVACARHRASVEARSVALEPAAHAAVLPAVSPPSQVLSHGFPIALPPPQAELVEFFAAQPEAFAWQSLYLFHPQPPLRSFGGFATPLKGPFPGRKFRHVFFHRFGNDRDFPGQAVLDSSVAGCSDVLLATDGRYCPSVSYPPIELAPGQVTELLAITNQRDKNPKVKSSGWQKELGFVFVDDSGTPIAEIAVGLQSGKVETRPASEALSEGDWGASRWNRLLELVAELDPKPSLSEAFTDLLVEQRRRDEHAFTDGSFVRVSWARYLPAYSDVDSRLREMDLSDEQRAIACAWQQLVWLRGVPRSGPGGAGLECKDGWNATAFDLAGCQRAFPRCEASMVEVETCMRRQRFDPCFQDPAASHCVAVRQCLWGFSSSSNRQAAPTSSTAAHNR